MGKRTFIYYGNSYCLSIRTCNQRTSAGQMLYSTDYPEWLLLLGCHANLFPVNESNMNVRAFVCVTERVRRRRQPPNQKKVINFFFVFGLCDARKIQK